MPLSDVILFAHPTFGVLAILASIWVLIELLNASAIDLFRARKAALVVTLCIVASLAGHWYGKFHYAEKAAILKGTLGTDRQHYHGNQGTGVLHSVGQQF
jgi:hypothetical protein